jgi:hypothetical protein
VSEPPTRGSGEVLGAQLFQACGGEDDDACAAHFDETFFAEAAQYTRDRFTGAADEIGELFVSEGHDESHLLMLAAGDGGFAPLEQYAGEAAGDGAGEGEAACVEEGGFIFFGERFCGVEAAFAVALKEGQKVFAADVFDARGRGCFGGDLVGRVGDDGPQAENVAGHGHFEDEGFSLARGAGEFDLSMTENEDAVGTGIFSEEGCSARESGVNPEVGVVREGLTGEIAEHAHGANFAGGAVVWGRSDGGHG